MTDAGKSSILVCRESEAPIGIITDALLRERVLVGNIPAETPICEVMSSPLNYIEETALIFEAALMLHERGIKHLVVRDSPGNIVGVISNEELLDV
ncbi:MAG: CBS domain-containing protein, partial [Desulfobacterales bacterium]|nr:CBS domain-containing protein [Desulfobacterales bacterium]